MSVDPCQHPDNSLPEILTNELHRREVLRAEARKLPAPPTVYERMEELGLVDESKLLRAIYFSALRDHDIPMAKSQRYFICLGGLTSVLNGGAPPEPVHEWNCCYTQQAINLFLGSLQNLKDDGTPLQAETVAALYEIYKLVPGSGYERGSVYSDFFLYTEDTCDSPLSQFGCLKHRLATIGDSQIYALPERLWDDALKISAATQQVLAAFMEHLKTRK